MKGSNDLIDLICLEFERHMIDCNDSKKAHFDLADYYNEKSRSLRIIQGFGVGVILAWLLSTQYEGLLEPENFIVKVTPIIIAIIVSIITALEPVLKYREFSLLHESFGKKYHTLWRSCKCWNTDFHNEEKIPEAKVAVQKYREQLNDLNRDAPHLSSILWRKISKIRARSGYSDVSVYSNESND